MCPECGTEIEVVKGCVRYPEVVECVLIEHCVKQSRIMGSLVKHSPSFSQWQIYIMELDDLLGMVFA
jgi:hypothetical protein